MARTQPDGADGADDVLEALASLPSFHHPVASHDGEQVAVYYDDTGRNELHLIDVDTGDRHVVSDGTVPRNARWHVNWSADDERVYFHMDDDGNEQNDIHAIDRDGNVEPVVEMDGQNALASVGDDGETLLVTSSAGGQMNVYRHDVPTGETTKVTDYDRAVWSATLAPDSDRIAYATNEADDYNNQDVYVADVDGSNPRNLEIGDTGAEASPVDWGPNGETLLVSDNSADLERAGIYSFETDDVTWFGPGEYEESPSGFIADGDRFLVTRTRDAATVPVVYDVETGEAEAFDVPEGVAGFGGPGGTELTDGRVLLSITTPDERPELYAYDLESGERETLLAADYGDVDPDRFADATYFRFDSAGVADAPQATEVGGGEEELEIGALLYDAGERPSPLIVNPHGGPRAASQKEFNLYTQFLVSLGFSVLQVNYRGSTGRGLEFVETLYDDFGGGEQADVANATQYVLDEHDWVDDDRVVVFGGSYGGYSAYWQMTQYPDLYTAGIAWIGVTDLDDMFENTMPHFRTELMEKYLGTPEENPELYRDRSPVTHAENLEDPLLMVHGVNDRRVPVSQARIFEDALVDAGYEEGEDADYEYVELGEEGHASSDISQKIRLFRILEDFLDRRV
ncbi:MAG: prolyl oligopeptidase family serine peptidase [Halopenitus sp.]